MIMEPEVIKVSLDSVTSSTEILGATSPENIAWVNINSETFAVGYLALKKYYANAGLKELKYERAIAKTASAVWAASQKLKLGCNFQLALACLLPPGELENKQSLGEQLGAALANYITPTGTNAGEVNRV